jgi:Tol biopolymer transport system component
MRAVVAALGRWRMMVGRVRLSFQQKPKKGWNGSRRPGATLSGSPRLTHRAMRPLTGIRSFFPMAATFFFWQLAIRRITTLSSLATSAPNRIPGMYGRSCAPLRMCGGPPGYLLFLRDNNLMAQAFDARRFEVSGEPLVVAEHVGNGFNRHTSDFSVSATGVLAWRSGFNADRELAWFDRSEKQITGLDASEPYLSPRLSPDGGRVALIRLGTRVLGSSEGRIESSLTRNIWLMDLGSGALSAFADGSAVEPVWSPDGRRIVFGRYEKGVCGLYWKPVSEIGDEELLLRSAHESAPLGFSPDGWFLLFHESDRGQVSDLFLLPLMGDRKPILISHNTVSSAAFSPDGRWIAYAAAGLGRFEVFVRSFAGGDTRATSGKWQVSTSGGWLPRWRHDGRELFYYSFYNTLVGVPVTAGVTFGSGAPVTLFDPHDYNQTDFAYDVNADGQRFLISRIFEDEDRPINIALDWLSLAKK